MAKMLDEVDEYIEIIKNINYDAAELGFDQNEIKKLIQRGNLFDGDIKLGIVGTGWITENAVQALKSVKRITIQCIMSRNLTRAEFFSEQHNIARFTDNIFGLVVNGCNAVYVASPTQIHFSQVRTLLFLGIHIICEKPLTVYRYEFNELVNIAKKRGLLLIEAWKTRFLPIFNSLRDIFNIANGKAAGPNMSINHRVKKIAFRFYYPMQKNDVRVDKSYTSLLRWKKNFCDLYYYPIIMATTLSGLPDLSSFNIRSMVTNFTSTYALKCGWLSLYGDIEVQITVAAFYNEPNVPSSMNSIASTDGQIVFNSITNIGSIQQYDINNKLIKERIVDQRTHNYQYMIDEFRNFSKLYYNQDLKSSFSLLRESAEANKIIDLIFKNTFNLFSNRI